MQLYFRESRMFQETERLVREPVPGISAVPDENNARYFHVVVAGPQGVYIDKTNYKSYFLCTILCIEPI